MLSGTISDLTVLRGTETDRLIDIAFLSFSDGIFSVNAALELVPFNTAPVATVADQTKAAGEWTRLDSVLTVSDADGDAMTLYEIWDSEGDASRWAGLSMRRPAMSPPISPASGFRETTRLPTRRSGSAPMTARTGAPGMRSN